LPSQNLSPRAAQRPAYFAIAESHARQVIFVIATGGIGDGNGRHAHFVARFTLHARKFTLQFRESQAGSLAQPTRCNATQQTQFGDSELCDASPPKWTTG